MTTKGLLVRLGAKPRELAKRGLQLLGGVPEIDSNGVLASTLSS